MVLYGVHLMESTMSKLVQDFLGNLVESLGSLVLSALDRMLLPHAIVLAK